MKSNRTRELTILFLAGITGTFHLLNVSGLIVLSTMIVRSVHLMLLMAICFLTTPFTKKSAESTADEILRWLGAALVVAASVYMLSRWEAIATSGGLTRPMDTIVGVMMVLLTIEATRRRVGKVLAILTLLFLLYPFVSPYLFGILRARGYSFQRVFTFLFTGSGGLYGIPIGVSATYIILFTIYGAFLNEFGAGDFFYRLSKRVTAGLVAASAKSAVVFSTLIGMISGSAAGNVAVTGTFTIPIMKKEGYKPHEAGAIEAVVSTGGQIMPPIMGASAFIMAEIIGTPYVNIMKAGLVPALLFFTSIFLVVHLQAKRNGIVPAPKARDDEPSVWGIIKTGVPFIIPFATLIGMMISGYSPFKAAFYSIIILVGLDIVWHRKLDRDFFERLGRAIANGARSTVPIAVACAAAGIIAGILSVSGLGSKLSSVIVGLSHGIVLVALLFTMITSIILGMGLPTTASYLILATVVAPALAKMGVPLLTGHMFVFFYGCLSSITPPVALASYVAAGVADADINKVGWTAFRFGLTSYILPFMFFFGPALFLEGTAIQIIVGIVGSLIGVFGLAVAIVGYFRTRLPLALRFLSGIAGVLMVYQGVYTDVIGIVVLTVVLVLNSRSASNLRGNHLKYSA